MKESGIYKIINLITNQFYIGSAINLKSRKYRHLYNLEKLIHDNVKLQRSFNKYGKENFIFEVIEIVENKENLINREQFYIDTLNPYYNICKIANSRLGVRVNEESKNKMSLSHIGQISLKRKPIFQYDLNGKLIKEYESIENAIKTTNIKDIRDCLKGRQSNAGGYLWRYKNEEFNIKKFNSAILRQVIQLDLQGNFIAEFSSCADAKKKTKIWNINACLNGNRKQASGYVFKYSNECQS